MTRVLITLNVSLGLRLMRVFICLCHLLQGFHIYLTAIGVARGPKGSRPSKFLENIVILCFERLFSMQNSVIRLKSNILAPANFWAGYATAYTVCSVTN